MVKMTYTNVLTLKKKTPGFMHCSPPKSKMLFHHIYNKLPITIKQIDSLNTFKSHLKASFFFRVYGQSGLTVREDYALRVLLFVRIMHCKFWGFA